MLQLTIEERDAATSRRVSILIRHDYVGALGWLRFVGSFPLEQSGATKMLAPEYKWDTRLDDTSDMGTRNLNEGSLHFK